MANSRAIGGVKMAAGIALLYRNDPKMTPFAEMTPEAALRIDVNPY